MTPRRRPAIIAVDDDTTVVASIARDLRRRYGEHHWIITAGSGAEALQIVRDLAAKREVIALVVADQRMPGMTGIELLRAIAPLCPGTRAVLLTAYADTQVAIDAINDIGLDHYLLKPWDPPDERLYPVLDDLLRDWRTSTYLPWDGIQVLGAAWSGHTHELTSFLSRQRIPYHYADVEADAHAAATLAAQPAGSKLPIVVFPDGTIASDPDLKQVAARVGLRTEATAAHYDVVIVGAGPAGLAASVYCAAEGLRCLVVEKGEIGGLASTSPRIENYLGFPAGIAGADLTRRARDQATRLGAEILSLHTVTRVRVDGSYRVVRLADGAELTANAVLIATGAAFARLPAAGADRFHGAGIQYAVAHAEARHYAGQDVVVVGGGNSAAQAALLLAAHARHVEMLVRGRPIASQYLLDAIAACDRITVATDTTVTAVHGGDRITEVVVAAVDGARSIPASALFVFVGVRPASDVVADLVVRDPRGFILTGPQLVTDGVRVPAWPLARDPMLLETSVPGVFAVGDVRAGTIGRVAWAAGEGGAAVSMILSYLKGWDAGSRGAAET